MGKLTITSFDEISRLMDLENHRPKEQWWMELRSIARILAQPGPTRRKLQDKASG